MSDSLADRLKKLSQQRTSEQVADLEGKKFQDQVNSFIFRKNLGQNTKRC